MVARHHHGAFGFAGGWRRAAALVAALAATLACAGLSMASAAAAPPPPNGTLNSTDSILRWINDYRHKPDPEALPGVVRTLSAMQAFKDAESSGPYIGFIAGVLGSNASRAEDLIAKMLPMAP